MILGLRNGSTLNAPGRRVLKAGRRPKLAGALGARKELCLRLLEEASSAVPGER